MPPSRWKLDDYSTFAEIFDEDLLREMSNDVMLDFLMRTLKKIMDHPLEAPYVTVGKTRFHVVRAGGYIDNGQAVPELLFIYIAAAKPRRRRRRGHRLDAMIARASGRPIPDDEVVGVIHPVRICRTIPGQSAKEQEREMRRVVERTLHHLDRWKAH